MEVKLPVCVPLNPPGPRIKLPTLGFKSNAKYFRLAGESQIQPCIVFHLKRTIQPDTFAGRTKEKQASPITVVLLQQYLRNLRKDRRKYWEKRRNEDSSSQSLEFRISKRKAASSRWVDPRGRRSFASSLTVFVRLYGPNRKSQHKFQQKIALAKNKLHK